MDTERLVAKIERIGHSGFTPLDPLVDTESRAEIYTALVVSAVSLPSIHSWILKVPSEGRDRARGAGFTPLDPLVDTESSVEFMDDARPCAVSLPSIHSWILKVDGRIRVVCFVRCFTPLDPLVDTERRHGVSLQPRPPLRFTPLDPLVDTESEKARRHLMDFSLFHSPRSTRGY